jgi:hypothetical protein
MERVATFIVGSAVAYASAGAVFAIIFVTVLVHRLDPAAANTDIGFRLMIVPGAAALWPLILKTCLREVTMTADLRRYHRRAWLILAVVLPLLFILARAR